MIGSLMKGLRWLPVRRWRIYGAPVYVHVSVVLAGAVALAAAAISPARALLAAVAYFLVVLVHEMGHAMVVHRLGYAVFAIRVGIIHGRCEFEAPDTEWEDALIAWGGVAAQFVVASATLVLAEAFWSGQSSPLATVFFVLGYVNLVNAAFNLLPLNGLDGKRAWRVIPGLFSQMRSRSIVRKAIRGASKRR